MQPYALNIIHASRLARYKKTKKISGVVTFPQALYIVWMREVCSDHTNEDSA